MDQITYKHIDQIWLTEVKQMIITTEIFPNLCYT